MENEEVATLVHNMMNQVVIPLLVRFVVVLLLVRFVMILLLVRSVVAWLMCSMMGSFVYPILIIVLLLYVR
jgi:hypothetical protein